MIRTHLAITFFFIILFIQHIGGIYNKILFVVFILISSIFPDIDVRHSTIGRNKLLRPFQLLIKHRDVIHSLTFCLVLTLILLFIYPIIALAFFIGYSIHLFIDSFTPEGIAFFWPYQKRSKGKVKTNGVVDKSVFFIFLSLDIIILIFIIIGLFN
jgi:inner membrane protein